MGLGWKQSLLSFWGGGKALQSPCWQLLYLSLLCLPHLPLRPTQTGGSCSRRKVCASAAGTVWAEEAEAGWLPGVRVPCVRGGPHLGSPVPASSPAPPPSSAWGFSEVTGGGG